VRVLLVNWQDRINPQAGGAEIHLHEVFGRLAAGGVDVTLLASSWHGADRLTEIDGLRVVRTGSRYGFGAAAPRTGRHLLSSSRFDLVVEALNKVPVFSPLWANVPVVLLVHHLFGATAFREASLPLASLTWLLERPIGRVYRGVPVQAISHSTSEDLQERGLTADDIEVIHPGVDLGFFSPSEAVERDTEPTFLYLGRLKRYKGVDIIVRALAKLAGDGEQMRLLIGGRGEWEPNLRRLVDELGLGDRVEFMGFVSEERKRELFRTSWANVYPSPKEGWGITNLEAAACGTPAIASDSPGLRESVLHEQTGLLVPHGDVNAMAGAMRRLASDPAEVERLGAGALTFARSFTWERTAEATLQHLQRAAGRPVRTATGEGPSQSSRTG
jgi:glycosyltransferase involved in cell wall biosynthesis